MLSSAGAGAGAGAGPGAGAGAEACGGCRERPRGSTSSRRLTPDRLHGAGAVSRPGPWRGSRPCRRQADAPPRRTRHRCRSPSHAAPPPRPGRLTRIATVLSGTWLLPSRMPGSAPPVGSCAPGPADLWERGPRGRCRPMRGRRASGRQGRAQPAYADPEPRLPPLPRSAGLACLPGATPGHPPVALATEAGLPRGVGLPGGCGFGAVGTVRFLVQEDRTGFVHRRVGRAGRLRGCRARCRRPLRFGVRSSRRLGRRLALQRRRTAGTGHPRSAVPVPDVSGNGRVGVVPLAGPVVTGCRGWGAHHRGPVSLRSFKSTDHIYQTAAYPRASPGVWATFRSP